MANLLIGSNWKRAGRVGLPAAHPNEIRRKRGRVRSMRSRSLRVQLTRLERERGPSVPNRRGAGNRRLTYVYEVQAAIRVGPPSVARVASKAPEIATNCG